MTKKNKKYRKLFFSKIINLKILMGPMSLPFAKQSWYWKKKKKKKEKRKKKKTWGMDKRKSKHRSISIQLNYVCLWNRKHAHFARLWFLQKQQKHINKTSDVLKTFKILPFKTENVVYTSIANSTTPNLSFGSQKRTHFYVILLMIVNHIVKYMLLYGISDCWLTRLAGLFERYTLIYIIWHNCGISNWWRL